MLLVDEATRFKKCGLVQGQEHEDLLQYLYDLWIYHFGPPERLVLDQQVALMGHQAASEFERLGISRCPRGTTAGHGADQHTGTGIVERHVQLIKLTMYKLRAELQRQGLKPNDSELAQEAAMAQNITLSYGGVTPAMAVYGILPREFYNPESDHVLNTSGAADTDLTVFERALRIRQTSLAQAQQAVIEDRVARAARTKPHQLDIGSLVAGTSEVEFMRDVKGDPGWRGPALLLRLDADEGVAIIQYQGKPYLVALRHVRPFKGIYHLEIQSPQLEDSLRKLMKYVENMTEYKIFIYGWIRKKNDQWIKLPKNNHEATDVLAKANNVSAGMTKRELHGIIFGRSLRSFKPPAGTHGVLITWLCGSRGYAVQEHHADRHLQMKKLSALRREELCILYLFYYQINLEESGNNIQDKEKQKMTSSTATPMDEDKPDLKRPGPDTRTVVLAPEKKRQKIAFIRKDLEFLKQWYSIHCNQTAIQFDFSSDWHYGYDLMTSSTRNFLLKKYDSDRKNLDVLFTVEYKTDHQVLACIRTADIYKVDTETNNFEDHEISAEMWPKVDEADSNEIKQFVEEKALRPIHRMQITDEMVTIDCKWVRKMKRQPDGTMKVKSRLCARGCFDSQKQQLTTRSTTATRLSQRILVSQAARKKKKKGNLESWDIAGAFLKGFDFKKIQAALRKLGMNAPTRQVVVFPPMNVWRHLQRHSDVFKIPTHSLHDYGLLCLKPIYGLNDAPLAWQLCLHSFIVDDLHGVRSQLDENCFLFKSPGNGLSLDNTYSMITTHVDDLAVEGTQEFLDKFYDKFVKQFKKVSRQTLPFTHCGCRYSQTSTGYSIDQAEFVQRMKPAPVPTRSDDAKLEPSEVSDFRSILGALLWITATRLDIVADVSVLQSRVTTATVKDIKLANEVLVKAKQHEEAALHYRSFETDALRLACIHDASSANSGRHYAQEGILVMLTDDAWSGQTIDHEVEFNDQTVQQHGGVAHILHSHGGKAKRISYSTSHAETLSMVNGLESTTLIMIRLSEMMHEKINPTLRDLTEIQENGNPMLPCDHYTDCRDLWELSTGQKVLPQDKTQRLYVLGIREARITGRVRMVVLVPTESMVADALTKPMISSGLLHVLTTGRFEIFGMPNHPVLSRVLPSLADYDEQTLMEGDEGILEKAKNAPENVKATHASILFGMIAVSPNVMMRTAMVMGLATLATAEPTDDPQHQAVQSHLPIYMMIFMTVIAAVMVEKLVSKIMSGELYATILRYIQKKNTTPIKDESAMDVDTSSMDAMDVDEDAEALQLQLANLRGENADLQEYQGQLEANRDWYKTKLESKEDEHRDALIQIQSLENDLERERREHKTTTGNYKFTQNRLAAATATIKEKDERIEDLKKMQPSGQPSTSAEPSQLLGLHHIDMRVMKEELEKLKIENEVLSRDKEKLQSNLESAKNTIRRNKETIDRMTTTYHELRSELQKSYYPEEIHVTANGRKYHMSECRHLKHGQQQLNTTRYTKCYDCCNKA